MDSLAMLVTETLRRDPFCGDLSPGEAIGQNPRLGWHGFGFVFEAT
jgi:hypothetical protein